MSVSYGGDGTEGAQEQVVYKLILEDPSISQKALAHYAGMSRATCMRVVNRLINKNLLTKRGYFPLSSRTQSDDISAVIFINNPDTESEVSKLHDIIRTWSKEIEFVTVTGRQDYIGIIRGEIKRPNIGEFYREITRLGGALSETSVVVEHWSSDQIMSD